MKIADTRDYADTSMEDMQAIRIGRRDILAIGLQDCGNSATAGTVGLELYDITNPRNPQFLTLFNGEDIGMEAMHGHGHEFDLVKRRDARVLAALASPNMEAITFDNHGLNGVGDLLIVDLTNPSAPTLVSEYGVLDDPMFGVPFYLSVRRGGDARTLDHSARFNDRGTRLYLSLYASWYSDGIRVLNIGRRSSPREIAFWTGQGAPANAPPVNIWSVVPHRGLLLASDRDFGLYVLKHHRDDQ